MYVPSGHLSLRSASSRVPAQWYFLILASYMVFLNAGAAARKQNRPTHQSGFMSLHRNEGRSLDAQLDDGERIVARLTSEIGAQKTSELLEGIAKKELRRENRCAQSKAGGVQPSVVDLISGGEKMKTMLTFPMDFGCASYKRT